MDHSLEYEYRAEQRMIQFRAKIWKSIHQGPNSKSSPAAASSTSPVKRDEKTVTSDQDSESLSFCERFLRLPGEVRNQIYDELLRRRPQGVDFGNLPLFRAIHVTNQSHAGAAFAGAAWLPINPFTSLRYIGRNTQIWGEIFSRWTSCIRFTMTEAFELYGKPRTIKDRIFFRQQPCQNLSFSRYLDPEVSRVFNYSNSWFPLLRSCDLNLHILGLDFPSSSEEALSSRLLSRMTELASVLQQAKHLIDIDIKICFWPGSYQERVTWAGSKFRPDPNILWASIEPLKKLNGITAISIHAGNGIDETWEAKRPINKSEQKCGKPSIAYTDSPSKIPRE